MELITNFGAGHKAAIAGALDGASSAAVACAFLKKAGAEALAAMLTPILAAGGEGAVYVGTDFFLTHPDALEVLLKLSERFPSLFLRVGARSKNTFHPKVYAGFTNTGFRCLTGSANLTGGALTSNVEASILIAGSEGDPFEIQLRRFFDILKTDARYSIFDSLELLKYRSLFIPVEKKRKELERAVASAESGLIDLSTLDDLYTSYLADPDALDDRRTRNSNRAKAKKVQKAIAGLADEQISPTKLKTLLRPHLNDLMTRKGGGRHLWASDAIFRKGSASINMPKHTAELFARAVSAIKLPVEDGYAELRDLALVIPGLGTNMLTEILSTFAPSKYAVLNGNTRQALESFGLKFPGAHSLGELKPEKYGEIVRMIASVRDRIGASNFAETDAFLNWVFQRSKETGLRGL